MQTISYAAAPYPVRDDLSAAHGRAWARLAAAGTWFTGAERVAIAAEARQALTCALCRARKAVLSPYSVDGAHDTASQLPAPLVDAIHRIRTDPGRLRRAWFDGVIAAGVAEGDYVEALGVVVTTVAVDSFARGIGVDPPPLPTPLPGEPSRHAPERLKDGGAWLPMLSPDDVAAAEADLFPTGKGMNSKRAMTLVPDEVRGFFDLVETQYYAPDQQWDFANEFRAISHAQVELVAGRVSAMNGCAY